MHYASVYTSHENFIIWIINSRLFRLRWPIKVGCSAHEDVRTVQQLMCIIFVSSRGRVRTLASAIWLQEPKGGHKRKFQNKKRAFKCSMHMQTFSSKKCHFLFTQSARTNKHLCTKVLIAQYLHNKPIFLTKSRLTKDFKYLIQPVYMVFVPIWEHKKPLRRWPRERVNGLVSLQITLCFSRKTNWSLRIPENKKIIAKDCSQHFVTKLN